MDKVQVHVDRDELTREVREQVAAELGLPVDEIAADAVLKQLPGADSVKMLRVVAKVERRYDVEFEDEDIFSVRTAAELAALIESTLAAR